MDRRGYLALVGSSITVGIAGCGEPSEPDGGTTAAPGGTQPEGGTPTVGVTTESEAGGDTATAGTTTEQTTTEQTTMQTTETQTTETETTGTQTAEPQTTGAEPTTGTPAEVSTIVIEGSILADGGPGTGPGKHVEVTITNQGDAASGEATITVRWYDENGTLVASSNETAPRLGAGETAVAEVHADVEGATAEEIADYDVALDAAR